jgi:uncharacterized membrane protein
LSERADRDTHTIHRLEAFSDIVMGFCLAQLGVNLVMPKGAADAASVWASATFFISAFVLIALLWWMHHRTFSTYFVLNLPMIVMNFGMLCGLILTLYFFESVIHVASVGRDARLFFALFVYAFAVVYTLLGGMLLMGILVRRKELSAPDMRWGVNQVASIPIAVVLFVAVGTYAVVTTHRGSVEYAAMAMAAVIFLVRRVILPRWLRRAIPDPVN